MAAEVNLSTPQATAQSIDMANRFGTGMKKLLDVLGITRIEKIANGGSVRTYKFTTTIDGGDVEPGDIIPLSKVVREVDQTIPMELKKRRKAVPLEDITRVGYEQAIEQTDRKFLSLVRGEIKKKLFAGVETGTGTTTGEGLQQAMANALAALATQWEDEEVETVAFIHPEDYAQYAGTHQITLESEAGLKYLKNFMGFDTVIVSVAVTKGFVNATVADNLLCAYVDPTSSDVTKAFDFVTDPDLPMIAVLHDSKSDRLTCETILWYSIAIVLENQAGAVKAEITEAGA